MSKNRNTTINQSINQLKTWNTPNKPSSTAAEADADENEMGMSSSDGCSWLLVSHMHAIHSYTATQY